MDDIDSCDSAVQKVHQITRDMENGEYEADSDYDSEEEDMPRIIEMCDMACAALQWDPPATYELPSADQFRAGQRQDPYTTCNTSHIIRALTEFEQGNSQPTEDEAWAQKHQSDYAIKQWIPHKAWLKGKAQHAKTQWQLVVPHHLQAQVIQGYHSSKRNAHYGDLKTFAQLRENFSWNSAFSDVRKFVL